MLSLVALVDFLNSREKAVVLWTVAIVVYAAVKGEGVVASFVGVLRALAQPKLVLLFGSAALYCAGLVLLAIKEVSGTRPQ